MLCGVVVFLRTVHENDCHSHGAHQGVENLSLCRIRTQKEKLSSFRILPVSFNIHTCVFIFPHLLERVMNSRFSRLLANWRRPYLFVPTYKCNCESRCEWEWLFAALAG